LYLETGAPVEYILGLRASGLGWGEIEALLRDAATTTAPGNKNKPKPGVQNNNNKPAGQGNKPVKTPPGQGPKPPKPGKP
jgi:hypothetical protein